MLSVLMWHTIYILIYSQMTLTCFIVQIMHIKEFLSKINDFSSQTLLKQNYNRIEVVEITLLTVGLYICIEMVWSIIVHIGRM